MQKEIITEVMDINPLQATQFLLSNTANRKLSKSRVDNLANQMLSDKWEFNGDTIRISVTGVLLDGQHRLSALVKANKTLKFIVVKNLPDEVFAN